MDDEVSKLSCVPW